MENQKQPEVFEYDVEKAKQLLLVEGRVDVILAEAIAENIANLPSEMWPYVTAWLNGDFIEYEYQGITFTDIMNKEKGGYLDAIFSMNYMMEHPDYIELWKKRSFRRM